METGLGSMELYHVGIVVHDIEDGKQKYGELLGVDRWWSFESSLPSRYRGEEVTSGAKAAYGDSGPIYVELVEPIGDRWTASAFLEERGEGVYHLGYWVEDVPAAIVKAKDRGIGVDWAAEADGKPFVVYLEATAGVHLELVASSIRPIIEARLKPKT
ncbi:MAG TPA: VOC family protein [Actinomycetota bacterium]|nr:VOC family protein [Actinomycetota bacterium]